MTERSKTSRAPWAPKGCAVPEVMGSLEAQLYEHIRTIHCDRKRESHQCLGRVSLDRNGMTLQCPACGDSRTIYRKAGTNG